MFHARGDIGDISASTLFPSDLGHGFTAQPRFFSNVQPLRPSSLSGGANSVSSCPRAQPCKHPWSGWSGWSVLTLTGKTPVFIDIGQGGQGGQG
jgi:hypothetical protein